MTSHEYARKLRKAADFLDSRPEFNIPNRPLLYGSYYSDKDGFLAAVKALGSGTKKYSSDEIEFSVPIEGEVRFEVTAARNAVCRLVTPAVYDCEPLLSEAEEAQLTSPLPQTAQEHVDDIPF